MHVGACIQQVALQNKSKRVTWVVQATLSSAARRGAACGATAKVDGGKINGLGGDVA